MDHGDNLIHTLEEKMQSAATCFMIKFIQDPF